MSSVNTVRTAFLSYFGANGHQIVPSSPLVPRNDPTLMFTSAGMVQFKQLFTGLEKRSYSRAATAQKCLRAGGKHNDLENVGYTSRHHTFFEMLGNFSFGDYFKEEAIHHAWRLITTEFGLPKDRLLVTVYHTDDDARSLWRRIAGLPDDRIIPIATSDNFWSAGDTGPCGPCSEIFYDHGPGIEGGPPGSAEADGDRFIEIWNLVFMQFEQLPDGRRVDLPRPSIDTGMGLERISAVLQGTHDNYATDLMQAVISAVADLCSSPYRGPTSVGHRVIADHLRAAGFLIADGVTPSNEGRGYVLRRIMRRGMRHAQLLGAKEPLMHRLVPTLVSQMGQAYPELLQAERMIAETLLLEETRFRRTLDRGLSLLDEASRGMDRGDMLPGETAFRLYDTYGFPLDLTQDALRARRIGVEVSGFEKAMARQREEARKSWSGSGETATETAWFAIRDRCGPTEFLGYEAEAAEGEILAIVRGGEEVAAANAGETVSVIVNQTPFYAESGGQVGDTGLMAGSAARLRVIDTQRRLGDLIVHVAIVEEGTAQPGMPVALSVDKGRRRAIRANHSGTHLLHEALRQVLGDHIAQKGSQVSPDRIRFDVSHPAPMTEEQKADVEVLANTLIMENAPITTRLMDINEAMASGARALFGEKYGDEVRVVSMGAPRAGQPASAFSIELCGGTHAARTGDLGQLVIVSEGGVSSGVRRVEALTGEGALRFRTEQARLVNALAGTLRVTPAEMLDRTAQLVEDRKRLDRELAEARKRLAMGGSGSASDPTRTIGTVAYFGRVIEGIDMRDLKGLADEGKRALGSGVVAIAGIDADGKAGIVVGVTNDLVGRFNAVDLVRLAAPAVGGKGGGGRAEMAQAGGPNADGAHAALAAIEAALLDT